MTVALIDLGCANLASVGFALDRLGVKYLATRNERDILSADRIILPGVGSAGFAAAQLDRLDLRPVLRSATQPMLGICLGMQLLYEGSDEGDAEGLGLLPGRVRRLDPPKGETWPHMGWSRLAPIANDNRLMRGIEDQDYVYFVHGYGCPVTEDTAATTVYGEPFGAAVEKGSLFGCQFHPERSGDIGARILRNFLEVPC